MAKATDGTSFWESVVSTASEEMADAMKYLLKEEAPRPFGSEEVSEEEQTATYAMMRDDVNDPNGDALFDFFTENNFKFETAVKFVERMRKRLG